ncbi:MAG TPA: diaminopimelate decarboxylase [Gemmatimonadaceae bacterium]|nr:diaminopimelate decarboxylase [Gemmatimonadaceae bacterium]
MTPVTRVISAALASDGVPLDRIADDVGTPAYVYSAGAIRSQFAAMDAALAAVPHKLHYSVKANGNIAILRLLRSLGSGADIVSSGELYRAQLAGFSGADIVFSGVGKSERELAEAVAAHVLLINIESPREIDVLDRLGRDTGKPVAIGIRVNPEVAVETPHPYTRTGEKSARFGIPYDQVVPLVQRIRTLKGVRLISLGMHIGSQVTDSEPYAKGAERLVALTKQVREGLQYLDVGGGLAVSYGDGPSGDVQAFGKIATGAAASLGLSLIVEPGRFIVANAGILLTRVLDRKRSAHKTYVITDAGMTELLRPSHYNAYHRIESVVPKPTRSLVDICGPVCESGDFLALDRELDDVEPGELLAVHSVGAYGFVMSSNYNARTRPPEVMTDGGKYAVVRERETYDDLVRHEVGPADWRSA